MICSEAVIHAIGRAVVWHARHFQQISQLLARQQQFLEVAGAQREVKAQQPAANCGG
jgi:hypothetical protein